MNMKKRGLGRGLDSLLGGLKSTPAPATSENAAAQSTGATAASAPPANRIAAAQAVAAQQEETDGKLRQLPVDLLQRGRYQPRRDMHPESLEDLAASIKAQGIVQPITVRAIEGGRYEIIAGERRWRAAQQAGLHEVPAVVRELSDQAAMAMALIENIQREDLNPIEEADALRRLIDEFSLTQQEAADAVGRSRTAVTNLLRLLSLQEEVRRMLEHGDLEMGHARALLALEGAAQLDAARQVVARGLSVRETEGLVRRAGQKKPAAAAVPAKVDPDVRRLQDDLSERVGARVRIQANAKGKGKLTIEFSSHDELEGILARIR
jgi:ParB family chromosome partitioning protein